MTPDYATEAFRINTGESSADDPRVVAAVKEYLAALEAGRVISRDEFLDAHSQIAAQLSECLDALELLHHAAGRLRPDDVGAIDFLLADKNQLPLGDFRIVREIGRGGMGMVYEAVQLSLGRRVALKVLPFVASLDPIRLQRFKNEAHAAAQLHHTNIVPVYAIGAERGVHFYAMQLIEGNALSTLIEEVRRTRRSQSTPTGPDASPAIDEPAAQRETREIGSTVLTADQPSSLNYFRTVAQIVQQAAIALEHAHSFGIIHRDVKPANLILDGRRNLWITDFGLALFQADVQLTLTGDMLGTLRYMSPEQAEGDRVVLDHRTDIYSLGITLYELLTLEPAFAGSDRQLLLQRIKGDEPPAPRSLDKTIPRELETIVLKAIAKATRERYQSAQQLADDLQRWLDDQPILARRPSLFERAARWRRRHRGLVVSSLAFLFLTTLVLLASTVVVLREHSKTKAAWQREVGMRAAADESLRQARQAVDTFIDLEEQELANRPSMYQVRRKFLQTALEYYQGFLDQRHGDASVRAELAATSAQVTRIVEELSVLSGFAPLMMLTDTRVQKELKLSSTEVQQIVQLLRRLPEEWERYPKNGKDLSPETRQQQLVEFLRSKEAAILDVITKQQIDRLRQIAWQQRGPIAFKYPDVVATLELTRAQRRRINEIIDEDRPPGPPGPHHAGPPDHVGKHPGFRSGDLGSPTFRGGGPSHKPPPDESNWPQTVTRIVATLTPEQDVRWRALTGEPFPYNLHWAPGEWLPR